MPPVAGSTGGLTPPVGVALPPEARSSPAPTQPTPAAVEERATAPDTAGEPATRSGRVRVRKVRRIVRHVEPWSVLKLSVLFYAALFLIVCVASALLWSVARASGTVENVESFITSVGGFGNCEPIDGAEPRTTTTLAGPGATGPVDQLDPTGTDSTVAPDDEVAPAAPGDDEDCREGERLVGEFRFEDGRILQAFALGGVVLVLAGAAANVVLVLLFNLMSDLTGGVRLTVLEEENVARPRSSTGSPAPRRRD